MDNAIKIPLAIICIAVVAVSSAYIWTLQVTPPTPPPAAKPITGFVSFTAVGELEPFTRAANGGATPTYTIYHMVTPGVFPIASKAALGSPVTLAINAATNVGISAADNQQVGDGYKAYLIFAAYGGTADYLDIKAMLDRHPGLVVNSQSNVDIGVDGYPEVLFLLDMTGQPISPTAGVAAPVALTAWLTVEDVAISDNNPADYEVPGFNAQSGSGVLNWQFTVTTDNVGDSFVIGRIFVTYNRTNDYVIARKMTVTAFDGTQWAVADPVSETKTSTSYDAYYFPAAGVNYRWTYAGLYVARSSGSNLFVNIAWNFDYSVLANQGTLVTITLTTVQADANGGTTADNTDPVKIIQEVNA